MTRQLLNLATALSLLLCVAVVLLWARSYWMRDAMKNSAASRDGTEFRVRELHLISNGGAIDVVRTATTTSGGSVDQAVRDAGEQIGWNLLSMRREPGNDSRSWRRRHWPYWRTAAGRLGDTTVATQVVHVPYWPVALLCLSVPAMRGTRVFRRRRRASHSLCPACGYDLRATPGRCPECGEKC